MKNLSFKIFFWSLIFFPLVSQSEILKAPHMINVQKIINDTLKTYAPRDVFVAFDVDLTLTVPSEKAAQMPNILRHKKIYKTIMEDLSSSEQYIILNLLAESSFHHLIEEKEISLILKNLYSQGIKTIAFSACLTGPLGNIPRMEVWRYTTLKTLGLDFNMGFDPLVEIEFRETTPFFNRYPVFYRGVLCASSPIGKTTKGPLLNAFLKKMDLSPKIIIMVDDTKAHLEDIENALRTYDPSIKFIGIEYTKGREFCGGSISEEEFLKFWENLKRKVQKAI